MKIILLIIFGVLTFLLSFLLDKNKTKSAEIRKKMLSRINEVRRIEVFKNSIDVNHPISNSIINLLENFNEHNRVGEQLSQREIEIIEEKIQLKLPKSYKIFLKYFGDGGYWVYCQSIDSIQNFSRLSYFRKYLGKTIKLDGVKIDVSSLLCLMTEDSNGGAWCWLTDEKTEKNEWPLAYYKDNELHYKVENFTEWLKILTDTQLEVIMTLDIDNKLGLG